MLIVLLYANMLVHYIINIWYEKLWYEVSGILSIRELGTSCSYVGNFESCINMSVLSNGSIGKLKCI